MRIKLEKRPEPSRLMLVVTPVASVLLTMLIGVIVFDAIGIDGQRAVIDIFLTPLLASYKWQDVAVKAAPLIMFFRNSRCPGASMMTQLRFLVLNQICVVSMVIA